MMSTDYFEIAATLARQQPSVRHAIWWDTPPGQLVVACCGARIRREHAVANPSCPACRAALEQYDQLAVE